jgi:hypothetical protein
MIESLSKILSLKIFNIELYYTQLDILEESSVVLNEANLLKYQNLLVQIDNQLTLINSLLSNIDTFLVIINNILSIISLLPIPTAPFPITVGLIMTLTEKQATLRKILLDLRGIIVIIKPLNETYVAKLQEKSDYFNQLDENYQFTSNNQPIQISKSTPIEVYQGLSIFIKEDNSGSFLKHYGVGVDTSNVEIVRTDSSHVTDTQILVDKVKLLIDKYY